MAISSRCGLWRAKCRVQVAGWLSSLRGLLMRHAIQVTMLLVSIAFSVAACTPHPGWPTSTRPIVKIGLVAPFEGLNRQAGYEALAAMQEAIRDHQPLLAAAGIDVLPLALDDRGLPTQAQRAAQKIGIDPAVRAVVGPLTPQTAQTAAESIGVENSPMLWVAPFAVARTGGFVELAPQSFTPHANSTSFWLTTVIEQVGAEMRRQDRTRFVVAGRLEGWLQEDAEFWQELAGLPVTTVTEPADVQVGDGVLWLDSPDAAAEFLDRLRPTHSTVPIWIGLLGGDSLLRKLRDWDGPIYGMVWHNADYASWANTHEPATPTAYLVYRATQQTLYSLLGQELTSGAEWQLIIQNQP